MDVVYLQAPSWGEPPPDDATIWRYVSLAKLLHTLQTHTLFFSSVSNLVEKDPWEGHWSKNEFQDVIATFDNLLDLDWKNVMEDALKRSTFVNCWHHSNCESAAMWAIYGNEGIALKSTVHALKASFQADGRAVGVVAVKYSDRLPDVSPLTQAVFRKRPSFAHEREIRAAIFDPAAQGKRDFT